MTDYSIVGKVTAIHANTDPDQALAGYADAEPFEMDFTFTEDAGGTFGVFLGEATGPHLRHVVLGMHSIRLWGVDWWAGERQEFDAIETPSQSEPDADGMVTFSVELQPMGEIVIQRAEWWRALGYYLLARPIDAIWNWWRDTPTEPTT